MSCVISRGAYLTTVDGTYDTKQTCMNISTFPFLAFAFSLFVSSGEIVHIRSWSSGRDSADVFAIAAHVFSLWRVWAREGIHNAW